METIIIFILEVVMAYQTKQQQAVLRCLLERAEECLSAADLAEDLRQSGLTVGLATVYRQLDKLTQQGLVLPRRAPCTSTVRRQAARTTAFCCGVKAAAGWCIWTVLIWRRSAATSPLNTISALIPGARC